MDDDCKWWRQDPTRNPATGRKIMPTGKVYKQLKQRCDPANAATQESTKKTKLGIQHCDAWRNDPTRNPLTKRKINVKAKNGVHAQLAKICVITGTRTPAPAYSNIHHRRIRLIDTIKKHVQPVIHKTDTFEARVAFSRIIRKYLAHLQPCLKENAKGNLMLETDKQEDAVHFDRRIGTASVYGVAYLTSGVGLAKLLKFSCKLMSANTTTHDLEVDLLKKMSNLAETGRIPNMPMTYSVLRCNTKCQFRNCPALTKRNSSYYVVVNELADEDLQTWFGRKHSDAEYESILMQAIMAIYSFHSLGYLHHDCHLGNFLIHKINPGGFWQYKIGQYDIYIPNTGYLLVMWDPGLALPLSVTNFEKDYQRVFALVADVERVYYPTAKSVSKNVLHNLVYPMNDHIYDSMKQKMLFSSGSAETEETFMMKTMCLLSAKNLLNTNHVIVHGPGRSTQTPSKLINNKPYVL